MDKKIENPWKTLDKKLVYDNQWIKVEEHQVINPNGGQGIYGQVSFKNKAIAVIPLDNRLNTWLVGQYRYTLNEYSWEVPMGGGPLKDDPFDSAARELKEETGLVARKMNLIMRIHTSNSVTNEEGFVFLAEDLQQKDTAFDETEDLQIKKLPLSEALNWVIQGRITDAMSVAGILRIARLKGL